MNNNFIAIDPGQRTGIAVFSNFGQLIEWGTALDDGLISYIGKLKAMKEKHRIRFAVIDGYQNFGKRFVNASAVQAQIRCCKDVYPNHIMILSSQWNPGGASDRYKRAKAAQIYNRNFGNCHVTDAVLIGHSAWNMAKYHFSDQSTPFELLSWLAETWFRCPRRGEYYLVREQREEAISRKFAAEVN